MFKNLSPSAIGIRHATLGDAIRLAKRTGFAGVDFNIREAAALAEEHGLEYVKELFDRDDIIPGQWGLPVAWNRDDQWQADLLGLARLATVARELGCTRCSTWVPSGSDERPYDENWRWHVERFRPIAQGLADQGCRLGLEFIGPKTYRDRFRYPFLYTLGEMMDLARDIGTGNVGLLLDSWHLYTSGGTLADLDTISAEEIVVVHVNDAPEGIPVDEQIDTVRRLPMETGVIDLPGFVRKLDAMRYDGPVTPEPFSERVNAIEDPIEAASLVASHMERMWKAAGLQ